MTSENELSTLEASYSGGGLNAAAVAERRAEHGYNEVPEKRTGPVLGTLKRMWDPVSWLLEAAIIFELALGKTVQALFVFLLLVFSAITGQVQASRASRAIGFLHRHLQVSARAFRDGHWVILPSREVVPGDVVYVAVGDIVPADVRVDQGTVKVDESALTGESADVTKTAGDMLSQAATISHGAAIGTVSATGASSSYGKTAQLVRTAEPPGRLQKLLFTIVRYLAFLDVGLAIILVAAAVIRAESWLELLPFLVILFIATIPISMPSSFTVANSLEARALAGRGALVVGLSGVQEAAAMDVLLVDKTGTLTRNRPEIAHLRGFDGLSGSEVLRLAAAATDADAADTISAAITRAAQYQAPESFTRSWFNGFDPVAKVSKARITQDDGIQAAVVLGSPLVLVELAGVPADYAEQVDALATTGARVLAVATGPNEDGLRVRGLVALADSPREDAKDVLQQVADRGVRIIMITGDSVRTARAIAAQVGVGERTGTRQDAINDPAAFDVLAEVYPEDKHAVVVALQKAGHVVGMTGDGINDAPALKQADVGIAVGSATDVAKAAARIVLTGEGLGAVPDVIDSGHRVYRRMMTWTITKLARTAELAALLTFGFILAGFFPVSLSLIVLIVILNDLVTLTLGTDRAGASSSPERWDMPRLARTAAIFTVGWVVVGLGLLWYCLDVQRLEPGQVSALLFAYLIYSAMVTILMTRTRNAFWKSIPGRWVGSVVAGNIVLTTLLVLSGVFTSPVPGPALLIVAVVTVVVMFILDRVKVLFYRRHGILEVA
ncbi:HAD-IC family P-type ATPase [Arthrobacter sp. 1P04PC]|uniref:HAD-IC family P-type ATPase n=1 Tax=unclassified Arthrobacter TaxID=235627 RepID=UPI0039A042CC